MTRSYACAAATLVLLLALDVRAQEPPPEAPPTIEVDPAPTEPGPRKGPPPPAEPVAPQAPTAPTPRAAAGQPAAAAPDTPNLQFRGYVTPGFDFKAQPDAPPLNRINYGFTGGAGLIFDATPLKYWQAKLQIVFELKAIHYVEGFTFIDTDGDGDFDLQRRTEQDLFFGSATIDDATLTFRPLEAFGVKGGVFYVPFTAANQSPRTYTMFQNRAAASELFINGADIGAMVFTSLLDGRFEGSIGAFNGRSLGLKVLELETKGLVYALRADVNPFGPLPGWEGDPKRGPFRLGLGFGLLYRPMTLYDPLSGEEAASAHDVRYAASLRLSVGGLYVGVEYLHGQQTDSVSSRPRIADAGYVQGSFFIPVTRTFAFAPLGRLGVTAEDRSFAPRTIGYTDLGVSLFPRADAPEPDALKFTLNYSGERRFTEDEDAHGASVSAVLRF